MKRSGRIEMGISPTRRLRRWIMRFLAVPLAAVSMFAAATPIHEQHMVGNDWRWFTDYAYWSSVWTLNVQPRCPVEVGVGIMAFGSPLGGTHRFSLYYRFIVYGVGAIYVRTINRGQRCTVRIDMGSIAAIPIYGKPSLLEAAEDSAKAVAMRRRSASSDQIPARREKGRNLRTSGQHH